MKEFALLALVLLLSACVKTQPETTQAPQAKGELGSLGIQEDGGSSFEELPEASAESEDTGLLGEPLDLGPLV